MNACFHKFSKIMNYTKRINHCYKCKFSNVNKSIIPCDTCKGYGIMIFPEFETCLNWKMVRYNKVITDDLPNYTKILWYDSFGKKILE